MLTFERAMRERDLCVTAELPLVPASTAETIARDLGRLAACVDAVQVTDSQTGIPHMAPLVAAQLCLAQGIDPVVHLSGRDRNRIALQSELLGAAAAGVTSLLLTRGDRLPATLTPRAQKVYEFGAKRLLRCASLIGSEPGLPPANGFYLGSAVRVIEPPPDWRPDGINTKADVGCKFVQTQPLLETEVFAAYLGKLVASRVLRRVSLVATVPVITSRAELDALQNSASKPVLPTGIASCFDGSDARARGISLAANVMASVRRLPGVSAIHVSGDDAQAIAEAISLSEIRA